VGKPSSRLIMAICPDIMHLCCENFYNAEQLEAAKHDLIFGWTDIFFQLNRPRSVILQTC
jgi:hypothetical protein